ncbi:MAG: AAA family ATPase [Bacteroidota bacterium]
MKDNTNNSQGNTLGLDLDNSEFQEAYNLVANTSQTFFLTGKAGTGKSTFLRYFVETIPKNFVVVAPTGIAALNAGGVTIHSFFQLPPRPFLPNDDGVMVFKKGSEKRRIIQALDTLFIDEVSMVRIDLLHAIDRSLRINGGNPNLPFGGKQVVFVGDVFQLPPVPPKDNGEQQILSKTYGSLFFFHTDLFRTTGLPVIELKRVYRQTDLAFINTLDRIRTDDFSQSDLDLINECVMPVKKPSQQDFAITLTTTNEMANGVNYSQLESLKTEEFKFTAIIEGDFSPEYFPTHQELFIKVGAQVMFVKNDMNKRWVNGTIGQTTNILEPKIEVKLQDGNVFQVKRERWERIKYTYNLDKKSIDAKVIGTFQQFPVKLAWAATIHKSQGQTFDNIIVDMGSGAFCGGQSYVALSRVRSLSGLFLKRPIDMADIFVDDEVREFANKNK